MQPGRFGKARVAVLTILDEEFAAARDMFGTTTLIPSCHRAYSAEDRSGIDLASRWYDVVVAQAADRGNAEALEATNLLIEHFRPDFLILCGIAGGVDGRDDVQLGDAVVANYIHYGEYMKLVEESILARHGAFDQPSRSLHDYLAPIRVAGSWCDKLADDRPTEGLPPKVVIGPILSGEKVLSSDRSVIQQQLLDHYDNAVAVEMESYGFAKAVYTKRLEPEYNPQLLVVRGISDLVPSEANVEDRKIWKVYACRVAASLTKAVADAVLLGWPVPNKGEV